MHEPLNDWLSDRERAAIAVMRDFGADPLRHHRFWEALVARIVCGEPTPHSTPWDIEIDHPGGYFIRVEVKSSTEFDCSFSTGTRPVFRFAKPRGLDGKVKPCEALVLIGVDRDGDLHTWVMPPESVRQCRSITLTNPKHRKWSSDRSFPLDAFYCPPSQLLPEVLRSANGRGSPYDAAHHQANAQATRRAKAGQAELF